MDAFFNLMQGFATAATPANLLMCFIGVLLGQIIGILPGIGPSAAIALLLPLTYGASPTGAIIMFAGLYYGAQYGGTLTSVLINVPGESTSVMTAIDGHQMALQGRGGVALGISAIGSFVAGTVGTLGLMLLAPPLALVALAFGPPEYFALVALGLTALAAVGGSVLKGLATGVAGLIIGSIGIDPQVGIPRFTFEQMWLFDGVDFIVMAVALFGLGEVLATTSSTAEVKPILHLGRVLPNREEWRQARMAILRGTGVGFLIGILPAAGATIATFVAYIVEKKVAKDPSRLGKGAIEGVAGPEAANNSASAGAMVPMFSLGVPGSNTTAVMLGALIMFGLRPGPEMFTTNSGLVWAVIASMYIGNVILLVMNLPLAGVFARMLQIPYSWIYPPIMVICLTGVLAHANSVEDCWVMFAFGVLGWLMKRYDWPAAPMVLGLVLGPLFENTLRQSLTLSHGSGMIFLSRPISAVLIACAVLAIAVPTLTALLMRQRQLNAPGT
jgi:putative tricarboxylic transport membrane protein